MTTESWLWWLSWAFVAAFLIAYIVYITIRLKRRQTSGQDLGPYQGTAMTQDHPAANITPFGSVGPHSGGNYPRFSAYLLTVFYSLLVAKLFLFFFCLDFRAQPRRRHAHRLSSPRRHMAPHRLSHAFHTRGRIRNWRHSIPHICSIDSQFALLPLKLAIPSNKAKEARTARDLSDEFGFQVDPMAPPPPAYHREPCQPHFDDHPT